MAGLFKCHLSVVDGADAVTAHSHNGPFMTGEILCARDYPGRRTSTSKKKRAEVRQAETGGGASSTTILTISTQESVANPSPNPQLQVGQSFKMRLDMDMAEEMTRGAVPLTINSRPFYMSYHLKWMCISNYGGQHVHRRLSSCDHDLLADWKAQLCGRYLSPVMDVDARYLGGSTFTTSYTSVVNVIASPTLCRVHAWE